MLESAAEGTGSCGIVVQESLGGRGTPDKALWKVTPWRAIVPLRLFAPRSYPWDLMSRAL